MKSQLFYSSQFLLYLIVSFLVIFEILIINIK